MDEPIIGSQIIRAGRKKTRSAKNIPSLVRTLMNNEFYGVLATQKGGQPYASLLAFANSPDLKTIVFSTPKTTRKYKLMESCKRVAFQIDNRPRHLGEFMTIESITAIGWVSEVSKRSNAYHKWSELLTNKHPYLKNFVESPSCALLVMHVKRYFHVVRFQEVTALKP